MEHLDIPIWPGSNVEFPCVNLIRYCTGAAPDDVSRFYQAEMPRYGWVVDRGTWAQGDQAVLCYEKSGRTMAIIIDQDHRRRTRVMIQDRPDWPEVESQRRFAPILPLICPPSRQG